MKNIIFVCTGNTCRSPLAEYILKEKLRENNLLKDYSVSSYGITPVEGEKMSSNSKQVLINHFAEISKEDIDSHKAKPLTLQIAKSADYIFCVSSSHKQIILSALKSDNPDFNDENKVFVMDDNIFSSTNSNKGITDPYGSDINCYEECFNQIKKIVDKIFDYIIKRDNAGYTNYIKDNIIYDKK